MICSSILYSAHWMNLLVVCWLKHYATEVAKQFYECCISQLQQLLSDLQDLLSILKNDQLASYTSNTASRKENFGQEKFGKSLEFCQIYQDFLPPKFCIVRHCCLQTFKLSFTSVHATQVCLPLQQVFNDCMLSIKYFLLITRP